MQNPNLYFDPEGEPNKVITEIPKVLKSLEIDKQDSKENIYKFKYILAKAYLNKGNYKTAFPILFECLNFYKHSDKKKYLPLIIEISLIFTRHFFKENKFDIGIKAAYYGYECADENYRMLLASFIGNGFICKNELEKSLKYHLECCNIYENILTIKETMDRKIYICTLFKMAFCYEKTNNIVKAFENFKKLIGNEIEILKEFLQKHEYIYAFEFLIKYCMDNNFSEEENIYREKYSELFEKIIE